MYYADCQLSEIVLKCKDMSDAGSCVICEMIWWLYNPDHQITLRSFVKTLEVEIICNPFNVSNSKLSRLCFWIWEIRIKVTRVTVQAQLPVSILYQMCKMYEIQWMLIWVWILEIRVALDNVEIFITFTSKCMYLHQ